jgi:hypothetical protein
VTAQAEAARLQDRLPDAEPVLAGHFARRLQDGLEPMTAAQAVALFLHHPDPRGLEAVVPRKVLRARSCGCGRCRSLQPSRGAARPTPPEGSSPRGGPLGIRDGNLRFIAGQFRCWRPWSPWPVPGGGPKLSEKDDRNG